ncbi:MAG: hypothetical protein O3B70_05700 [Bacteroidetes bacterium]|nr:hypothetical protein [Bacteroidota bacterium]MDA0903813.1 hypothetical protein [Bacteroidota bacterium]MDA1242507.1 hypothetical protein [Bacteroidota bacterium]
MSPTRLLTGVLFLLLGYNAAFFFFHVQGDARAWASALSDLQSLLNVMELIAVLSLFVDLVVRFDQIPKTNQPWRTLAVGICVAGMLFKWFVLYLRLSYLVD